MYFSRANCRGWIVFSLAAIVAGVAAAFGGGGESSGPGPILRHSGDAVQHRTLDLTGKYSNKGLEYRNDVVLVGFYDSVPYVERNAVIAMAGLRNDPTCESPYFFRLFIPAGSTVIETLRLLQLDPRIRFAEPDYIVRTQFSPNDPLYPQLYGMHNTGQTGGTVDADIDAPEAWDIQRGSSSVVIAVIDTGVDYNHADLTQNILRVNGNVVGYDYANNDNNPMDDNGHGTHCSGTIGGVGNNAIGVAGVCHNVRIMPCKFLSAGGSGSISNAVLCTDFARTNGANIMSNSWGGGGFSQAMLDAINRAKSAGILFVAAAGNNSSNNDTTVFYPASYASVADNVMPVAATTNTDSLAGFSNYGATTVDIAAPGNDILSTYPVALDTGDGIQDGYTLLSGTSMATPHVAGAAGLILAQYPASTYVELKQRLMNGADPVSAIAGKTRSGRLNVYNSMDNDTINPGTPTGLMACKRSTSTLLLQWTSSGDDGNVGTANSYDLRYSSSPIHAGNFASAPKVGGLFAPQPSGSTETFGVSGLVPGATYYFALQARDNVGNASGIVTAGPYSTLAAAWTDDVEGAAQFAPQSGPWAITTAQSKSPTRSWTDSPAGNYANNLNIALVQSGTFNITQPAAFNFSCKYALESGYDYLYVEASSNGGGTWTTLLTLNGTADWSNFKVSLATFVGQNVKIRFRMTTDSSVVLDGVYLDDFSLVNLTAINIDDLEGVNNYSADAPWALTTAQSYSPTRSYTDSPAGNYVNNLDISIARTTEIPINGVLGASLEFATRYALESGYDFLHVLASGDNGASYTELGSFSGTNNTWSKRSYNIPSFANVKFRFRLTTDYSVVADGVYIDDIALVGEPAEDINTVMGRIDLGDYVGTVEGLSADIEIRTVGGGMVLDTATVTLDANGNYSFTTNLPSGNYDIYARASHWLPSRMANVAIAGCIGGVDYALTNGNAANDDSEINLVDFSTVAAAFASIEGDSNWNPLADLDGDGEVSLIDIGIVSANFGLAGDE